MDTPEPCLYCEGQPRVTPVGLCAGCDATPNIRVLYARRRGWTPEWEAHLLRLTARAKARLPLFGPDLPQIPARVRRAEEDPDARLARMRRRANVMTETEED